MREVERPEPKGSGRFLFRTCGLALTSIRREGLFSNRARIFSRILPAFAAAFVVFALRARCNSCLAGAYTA